VRSAGYPGCAKLSDNPGEGSIFTSTLSSATTLLWNFKVPLQGFESDNAGAFAPALGITLNPVANNSSDVLVLRTLQRDGHASRVSAPLATRTSNPTVPNATPVPVIAGSIMMIMDCGASTVFKATSYNTGTGVVGHATGGSSPSNSTLDLGKAFDIGARMAPLQTYIYYVGTDPVTNEPGLYRQAGATQPAELIIDGVEAFQVGYGEDTTNTRVASRYVAANSVGNWDRVMSVTISMLIRSEQSGTSTDTNTYTLLPAAVGGRVFGPFNDRRQRMVFTTTIALRNRAW